jgi:hypothetical protein
MLHFLFDESAAAAGRRPPLPSDHFIPILIG